MLHFNSKSKSQSLMIRGKAIEESLRFYISNKYKFILRQKDIIDYAFDYYYLRTVNLSNSITKKNSNAIPHLVRSGIQFFDKVMNKHSNIINYSLSDGQVDTYPDFTLTNIIYGDKKFSKCLIELKIVNALNFKNNARYKKQAFKYACLSEIPVILLYLVIREKKSRNSITFESYPQIISFFS